MVNCVLTSKPCFVAGTIGFSLDMLFRCIIKMSLKDSLGVAKSSTTFSASFKSTKVKDEQEEPTHALLVLAHHAAANGWRRMMVCARSGLVEIRCTGTPLMASMRSR